MPGAAISNPPEPITTAGTIVGTVQYMSPEQIQGHEADARSDLFAFGATLYEMLTGKRAFAGNSQLAVVSAILEKDPYPARDLQPLTPPALERVVRRCLAKDPENRWQNTRDLASELTWIAETGGTPAIVESWRRRRQWTTARVAVCHAGHHLSFRGHPQLHCLLASGSRSSACHYRRDSSAG